jgi:hypothetical protein
LRKTARASFCTSRANRTRYSYSKWHEWLR